MNKIAHIVPWGDAPLQAGVLGRRRQREVPDPQLCPDELGRVTARQLAHRGVEGQQVSFEQEVELLSIDHRRGYQGAAGSDTGALVARAGVAYVEHAAGGGSEQPAVVNSHRSYDRVASVHFPKQVTGLGVQGEDVSAARGGVHDAVV